MLALAAGGYAAQAQSPVNPNGAGAANAVTAPATLPDFKLNPYQCQMDEQLAILTTANASRRCVALRNLGQMRAYAAADRMAACLSDPVADVRREAALSLARTGQRRHLESLLQVLEDNDWSVRQAACIALVNLTGQELPFDGLADTETRASQREAWRQRIAALTAAMVSRDFVACVTSNGAWLAKERLARALGAVGEPGTAVPPLVQAVKVYEKLSSNDRDERLYLQACIRALGRLGGDEARQSLIALLAHPQWAVYAADALGDVGGEEAALALLKAFPDSAYPLNRSEILSRGGMQHGSSSNLEIKQRDPNDMDIGGGCKAWTPRIAYSVLFSLSRIDFSSPAALQALREITPNLIMNLPLDFDVVCIYEVEPWERICGWLLERAGLRQAVVDAAFNALGAPRALPTGLPRENELLQAIGGLAEKTDVVNTPFAAKVLLCACKNQEDVPLLLTLLEHKSGWVRINAAKTLMRLGAREGAGRLSELLAGAKDDADFGLFAFQSGGQAIDRGLEEFNDAGPRYKEAFLRALGQLGSEADVPLLVRYLYNDRNAMEIQYSAAQALAELNKPTGLEALGKAVSDHPIYNVRQVAREALEQQGIPSDPSPAQERPTPFTSIMPPADLTRAPIVFIRGPLVPPNIAAWQFSPSLQAYNQTDEGPTYRVGSNICKLDPPGPEGRVTPLTTFTNGFVADLNVSYDARKLIFSRREQHSPWWHICEMNADGSGLRQLTAGPYHDVQPNYMPDGRVVFSSSRIGARDEYHGYLSTALTVMNADGSDIHPIGFNCGRDCEPVVNTDGRILFVRLEDFYSLPKLEFLLESCMPDGTHHQVLYGPERRDYWHENISRNYGSPGSQHQRHRTVCVSQPQPLDGNTFLINSFRGPMIVGPGRMQERILREDLSMAVTTPFPLNATTLLCSAGARPLKPTTDGRKQYNFMAAVDHGLYRMDMQTGALTLIYNDPATSEFEARPLAPRPVPPIRASTSPTRERAYTGRTYCASIFNTQEAGVRERGKVVRVVEGMPMVTRHSTGNNIGRGWMNHGGFTARILGLVPVASDGSFAVELPADRLFHLQVLDADGYVIGNELNWHYVRPSENVGCIGCHEKPDSSYPTSRSFSDTFKVPAIRCLPAGGEMIYRAKNWKKWIDDENEERKRTVNSMNILGRF